MTTNFYGNQPIEVAGVPAAVVALAADCLMPPQYEEFCRAFNEPAKVSTATRNYWVSHARDWAESLYMLSEISEAEFNALEGIANGCAI